MHFQARSADVFVEDRMYVTDKKVYSVVVVCEGQDTAFRNEVLGMEATFKLELLNRTGYTDDKQYKSIINNCGQIRV